MQNVTSPAKQTAYLLLVNRPSMRQSTQQDVILYVFLLFPYEKKKLLNIACKLIIKSSFYCFSKTRKMNAEPEVSSQGPCQQLFPLSLLPTMLGTSTSKWRKQLRNILSRLAIMYAAVTQQQTSVVQIKVFVSLEIKISL